MVVKYSVDFKYIGMRSALKKVYIFAGILYVVSLILKIVGPFFITNPSVVGEFNQPLAGTLRFIFTELTSIVNPVSASFCLVIAVVMHLILASSEDTAKDED